MRILFSSTRLSRICRSLTLATLLIGLSLFAMQRLSGAFVAEFDGDPDEAAHFITGRMFWEYLSHPPAANPLHWAEQYYLHYPKIGIGHWPPGYYIVEGLWSLPFGSSRTSALWLQWLLSLAALSGLWLFARPRFPIALLSALTLIAIAAPVFQRGLEETMAEPACLLCAVWVMFAARRLLLTPDRVAWIAMGLSLAAAILVKGTGVCLVPVPFLILFLRGRQAAGPPLSGRAWLVIALILLLAVAVVWRFAGSEFVYWGGVTPEMPWPVPAMAGLLGWGFLCLAIAGVSPEPAALVSACVLASAVASSFVFRAMREPRHWIIVLPAILVLSGYALLRLRTWLAISAATAALLLFPWGFEHQTATGYQALLRQLRRPARMLISSGRGSVGEGGWISEAAIDERYPASVVLRASKVLAQSGWNGENYKLLVNDRAAIDKRLDELAVDVVIVDQPEATSPPHHVLLAATMATGSGWAPCGRAGPVFAWCRVSPPRHPRKPLVIEAGSLRIVEDPVP